MSDGESSVQSFSSLENSVEVVTRVPLQKQKNVKLERIDNSSDSMVTGNISESARNGLCSNDSRPFGGGKMKLQKSSTVCAMASKGDKLCSVCGDRALGCNFDAISCESCKAFFRRNALKPKQTKCIFEGNCKIDLNTRRFCPFCRLNKCFSVGMNKELIMGDDEKKKRLEKVKRNRRSTSYVDVSDQADDKSSEDLNVSAPSPGFDEEVTFSPPPSASIIIVPHPSVSSPESVASVQPVVTAAASSIVPTPSTLSLDILAGLENSDQFAELMKSKLLSLGDLAFLPMALDATAASLFQGVASTAPSESPPELMRTLTDEEEQVLQEIVQVYDLSFTVDLEPLVHIRQLDPSLNQLVNQSSITVLRLIKFAKRLTEFARLPQVCQIGILKGCWIHILILRSVSVYDSERDVWVTPRGDIPTEILKNATGFVQLHDDHVKYCKSIKSITGNDLSIVIILLVIVLFSPEGPHAVARELVSNVQDRYLVLLKHYLESRYGYGRAAVMFPELMSKLRELKEFAEIHGRCLVDINPREIEPIMLEILDLK